MESLLEVTNLHVNFRVFGGVLKVLNGVTFKVMEGEKIGLLGETGCGKTTTMKAIMRILASNAIIPMGSPRSTIRFQKKDILSLGIRQMQRIRRSSMSMIFQDPTASLNPVFKVGTQLMDVIKYSEHEKSGKSPPKEEIKQRAINVLREVALPDPERIMENYPIQLSGGMRQRVCIAMSLVSAGTLLIADEPGTSLDVTIQDQILRLLKVLVEEKGTSIILISHALGTVKGLADRTYVMYGGSMVEVARTEDVFSKSLHPYTQGLFKAVPKLTGGGIPEGIQGKIPDYLNPPKGCRFSPRCTHSMDICKKSIPPSFRVGEDHEVACYLYKE